VTAHLAVLALVLLDAVVRGVRLRFMLPVTLGRCLVVNTCGDAIASLTPARLGGEPVRFVGFLRSGVEPGRIWSLMPSCNAAS
jgi:hypothetical protein